MFAKIIEEEEREIKKNIEKEKKRLEKGVWWYNAEMETYDWTGKEPPGEDNPHPDGDFVVQRQCWPGEENLTEEQLKEL